MTQKDELRTDVDVLLRQWAAKARAEACPPPNALEGLGSIKSNLRWSVLGAVAVIIAVVASLAALGLRPAHSNVKTEHQVSGLTANRSTSGPVYADPPTNPRERGPCRLPTRVTPGPAASALVTVDPHPTSVTAVWYPGLNESSSGCVKAVTHANGDLSNQLAEHIRTNRPFPDGFNCTNDVLRGVILYFKYRGQAHAETVTVKLSGCPLITAPERVARVAVGVGTDRLASLAPADFARTVPTPPAR